MIEDTYRRLNEHITPSPGLNKAVLEKAAPRRCVSLRPAVALVVVLALILSAPRALANPDIYQLMHGVLPEVAARFAPVQVSCENNGIRMEVISASVQGDNVGFYLSFEDLEGQRLGEYTSLDAYIEGVQTVSSSRSWGYDEEIGKYTCLLQTVNNEGLGDQITIYVESLIRTLLSETETIQVPWTLMREDLTHHKDGRFDILDAQGEPYKLTDAAEITAMSYIGSELHVQLHAWKLPGYSVPMYSLHLTGPGGKRVDWTTALLYDDGDSFHRMEYVFQIAPEELENYTLWADITPQSQVDGPWRVTFDADQVTVVTEE